MNKLLLVAFLHFSMGKSTTTYGESHSFMGKSSVNYRKSQFFEGKINYFNGYVQLQTVGLLKGNVFEICITIDIPYRHSITIYR